MTKLELCEQAISALKQVAKLGGASRWGFSSVRSLAYADDLSLEIIEILAMADKLNEEEEKQFNGKLDI